jgi:hypothetical protein
MSPMGRPGQGLPGSILNLQQQQSPLSCVRHSSTERCGYPVFETWLAMMERQALCPAWLFINSNGMTHSGSSTLCKDCGWGCISLMPDVKLS